MVRAVVEIPEIETESKVDDDHKNQAKENENYRPRVKIGIIDIGTPFKESLV